MQVGDIYQDDPQNEYTNNTRRLKVVKLSDTRVTFEVTAHADTNKIGRKVSVLRNRVRPGTRGYVRVTTAVEFNG